MWRREVPPANRHCYCWVPPCIPLFVIKLFVSGRARTCLRCNNATQGVCVAGHSEEMTNVDDLLVHDGVIGPAAAF